MGAGQARQRGTQAGEVPLRGRTLPLQCGGDLASYHCHNIKGALKDHAGQLFILDTEVQQDEITAKATQVESGTARRATSDPTLG